MPTFIDDQVDFLNTASAGERVKEQREARDLLFEEFDFNHSQINKPSEYNELLDSLSAATQIIVPDAVQQEIYHADTGTHIIPSVFKNILAKIKSSFIIRPGSITDLQTFIKWASKKRVNYTIRGAGTWPFGGCVPLNGDVIVDLSLLDFMSLDADRGALTIGAGVLFPDARNYLRKRGFALRQETTNRNSGTIAGWIATGGIGLGTYKYGHVSTSVLMLMVISPDGEMQVLTPDDAGFENYYNSEGQFGIIAGAVIKVRKESFVTKPFALSFDSTEDARKFATWVRDSHLVPTSIIYFGESYVQSTYQIEKKHIEKRTQTALIDNDPIQLSDAREDMDIVQELKAHKNIVVLHFDDKEDYQKALKSRLFGASGESRTFRNISYNQLSTALAHHLWEHRFLPVQIKQQGPSLLVSETVLPADQLTKYQGFLQKILYKLLDIELKTEAHFLPGNEILVQSLFLADTRTLRHKIYFALVPLMAQVAYQFGARPYGIGLWNYPSIAVWRQANKDRLDSLSAFKKEVDPDSLINRSKFMNPKGQNLFFNIFKIVLPRFNRWFVNTYAKRLQAKKLVLSYPFESLIWKAGKFLFPKLVPPGLHQKEKEPISEMISVCAECDCCERVCPTSDVFGLYGPATPITRRITAERVSRGAEISQSEALGFLVCTRCDNCTRACPTDIPLTDVFDAVEERPEFRKALALSDDDRDDFVDRFWQIMKTSPLYRDHTIAEQKTEGSHLSHGLKVLYKKGFDYSRLYINPRTCIHCGMCSDENACMYGAREGNPRQIPELIDVNCALCNACVNFCPQNKIAQEERLYIDSLVRNAPDLEEKRYWSKQKLRIHDTTTVVRSNLLTEMADRYVTEEIIMEIDKEASTGKIPVSGSGQGDKHMGIGFDAERFAHFHIVGPAQNRLHEGDPEEELSIILGKRDDFCKFDREGNLLNPVHPQIKLMTPILYNSVSLVTNGFVELVLIHTAERQESLVVIDLERLYENYEFILQEGNFKRLPAVVVPRIDHDLLNRLIENSAENRRFLKDLWRMPMFEITMHRETERTLTHIQTAIGSSNGNRPLISGYLEISEYDLIGSLSLAGSAKEKVNQFLDMGVDVLHIDGKRNRGGFYMTSSAVRALHHYLMRIGRRHQVSIIASGGIRLASDTQKTIQRGAEATLIDFAALLAMDPSAYKAIIENKATTEKLLSLDIDWAIDRLNNQAESRKVQILEVLGASGFKDIKKTVGEEGRLIDFHKLENRIQLSIFDNAENVDEYTRLNQELIESEKIPDAAAVRYSDLMERIVPMPNPHHFYRLGDTNQQLYQRDFVWPGSLIESLGLMAAGDPSMLDFRNAKGEGLLGDGFDVIRILYNKDPMDVTDEELNCVSAALPLDKDLTLQAPWMFGGKSVGSIGLDTWRAHVIASRKLGIQYDTGEGGYPTCFFLNSNGEPIFFTEDEIQILKPLFMDRNDYTVHQIREKLKDQQITEDDHPELFEKLNAYPNLKPFHFMIIVDEQDEPFVSTELKTGLFGVRASTIKKARRVVIAYSQGAKMGIGGHILAQKVNKLVSYMRGVEGIERLNAGKVEKLRQLLQKVIDREDHPLKDVSESALPVFERAQEAQRITNKFKKEIWQIQEFVYNLREKDEIDPIESENIIRLCEDIIEYSYSSIISPFPFHNCYSIEDVKAFIDVVRMINPDAVIAIKVSPSIDIEFIAAGLGRIARDNTDEMLKAKFGPYEKMTPEMEAYARKYGMKIEVWLDGPRGGTGASPNIIKGQMGMHVEYAIPLIHHRLVRDGLRNYVNFIVSGGMRTYADVIKAVALGADGIIWGTAPLVAIGCDRNRNCHDGCSRGIATSNLVLQKLRDVKENTQQIINAFTMMQMQVMRALAALGFHDIRELRGRFDKIHWAGLKERVDHRYRIRNEVIKEIERDEQQFEERMARATAQSNCGVAAISGTDSVPGYILDRALQSMRNRGMDGVGMAKTLCFPDHPNDYAFSVLVKAVDQTEMETRLVEEWEYKGIPFSQEKLRKESRKRIIDQRTRLMDRIKLVFLDPYFEFKDHGVRDSYKRDANNHERDYREFGNADTDPGDIFRYFVRVKKDVLHNYIESELLFEGRPRFINHLFPKVTEKNYKSNKAFMLKAEDQFVFQHSLRMTRILYVSTVKAHEFRKFLADDYDAIDKNEPVVFGEDGLKQQIGLLEAYRDFVMAHAYEHHKHRYATRDYKIAAVMSCGKNFGVWKTAGREIPWETPDAPNNIIHVRLATGSDVEQMNAHPFAKLHTALTHNGETTNYEALKQRVEQFNMSPLASTDTEVAALKFHLTGEEWEYPDWALFESFSPTTGDDLELIDPDLRNQLEHVQRVEFASSPDGPYQYLCLRHNPKDRVTERVDLKDPADLRPNISAFWSDGSNRTRRSFSMIASEEQAIKTMLTLLDREGIIDGAEPDCTFASSGMISRYHTTAKGRIKEVEYIDRYGRKMHQEDYGSHYSVHRDQLPASAQFNVDEAWKEDYKSFFTRELRNISFQSFRWLLENMVHETSDDAAFTSRLSMLTWLRDYVRTLNPGEKALSSLIDIVENCINMMLDRAEEPAFTKYRKCDQGRIDQIDAAVDKGCTLVIDAHDFLAEGTDPRFSLASFLKNAHAKGWRDFILYRVRGQRLISPAVMGRVNTDDVTMDVFGAAGEYFGAFMQGGTVRLHGNAQNFCAMCMHHGNLYIFGNAGKVCGYASKGGKVFIMGDVVDRGWTNSVNDSRCQDLEVCILGSATKYAGESLMGGQFFFGGLHFDSHGRLKFNERPYLGTKMLGGASRGNFVLFDPKNTLKEAQYVHGQVREFSDSEWTFFHEKITETFHLSNIEIFRLKDREYIVVDGRKIDIDPDNFKLIVPKGGLKGYESH
ncbi:MAG: glutamate synthase-related protein [candidate division KSB1 bacterium]|jgi:glutamate synthase domain-containing protein 2/FAD/FMN-containing dehydrogenase/glutamate synthase domain-containing protein 1/ferredoxin|nr:glutamate synthase-related protein [candidate division KSB1 bacterium]